MSSWATRATEVISEHLWNVYGNKPWSEASEIEKMAARSHGVKVINVLHEAKLLPIHTETSFSSDGTFVELIRESTEWRPLKPEEN